MATITVVNNHNDKNEERIQIPFKPGKTLRAILNATEHRVRTGCLGNGACGLCLVRIIDGETAPPDDNECLQLSSEQLASGVRLACRVICDNDLTVEIINRVPVSAWRPIPEEQYHHASDKPHDKPYPLLDISTYLSRGITRPCGVAVDLGTTSISLSLFELGSGKLLTTRQISILAKEKHGLHSHITSLNPIRPQNKATLWETNALQLFEKGIPSFKGVVKEHGKRQYRFMKPLYVTKACLKCHAKQGYKEGDVRGGISFTFPLEDKMTNWPLWLSHILVLLIGVTGLILFNYYFEHNRKKVSASKDTLADSARNLELTRNKLEAAEQLVKMQKNISAFITTVQYIANLAPYQNVRDEVKNIIERSFTADVICFVKKDGNGELQFLTRMETKHRVDILSAEMREHINDVLESDVLTTCRIDEQEQFAIVIFPLKTDTLTNEVLIIAHRSTEDISSKLLEVYLGIASLAETMIHRIALSEQMVEANKTLEQKVEERTQKLNLAYKEMATLAHTDPLTKLFNRRNMQEKLNYALTYYQRSKTPFTIILCDIDHFKLVNDQYGHDCGDYVLTAVSEIMQSAIREQDFLARWGGEEFLFLLPNTDQAGGQMIAEKIRKKIANHSYQYGDERLTVTITFGVCEFSDSMDIVTCISKADDALYKGKQGGRNCVYLAE